VPHQRQLAVPHQLQLAAPLQSQPVVLHLSAASQLVLAANERLAASQLVPAVLLQAAASS
jgi:hypothetical protein